MVFEVIDDRPDGSKYEGNFYDGIKQGEGTYYWKDGSLY